MDPRLVADGRAVDVAYDAGDGQPKRTAEVVIAGSINGQLFELVRRRGARKTELLFTVGGKELTTQAVKDTQEVIDEVLGIGNGLVQRCCFFGQHSHTLQVRSVNLYVVVCSIVGFYATICYAVHCHATICYAAHCHAMICC